MASKPHPAARARRTVLWSTAVATVGLTSYLAVAAPASSASGSSTTGATSNGASDTPTTNGTIPRHSRRNGSTQTVPAPVQPGQSNQSPQPHTRSAGS
ncbi:MAG TPA: hypothetical protein VGJ03_09830 [Acidimicrobiales bacterium]